MKRVLRFLANALLGLFGLATLGSFIPSIPVLGIAGPMLTGIFGLWTILLPLFGAIWAFWRWRSNRKRSTFFVATLALFAAIGMTAVPVQQISVAAAHGAKISVTEALFSHPQADPSLSPETVIYAKHGAQNLPIDIYRPKARTDGNLAPVFIYIHGGGWGAETLKQRQSDYRWFAERGYLVMSFEYPLSSEKQPTWNVTHPLLGCALVWANANAARYGGDAGRIALWGESAGGNLVLNVSYMANAGTLKPACHGVLPTIRATAALYPVVDPARMYHNPDIIVGRFARMMTTRYTGGTPDQFPDRYTAIDASSHITAKAPPTLLIIPQSDHLLEQAAADAFAAKARAAGVTTRLIHMPYAEHSFDIKSGSIGNQMVRQTMLRFLFEQGLKP